MSAHDVGASRRSSSNLTYLNCNTPLYKACAENQYGEAKKIFERLIDKQPDGPEELKNMLLQKNYDGWTPIDAAIAAAGDSDSGDARLKLLLGAYIKKLDMKLDMLVQLFATEDPGKGIWTRQGFKLPQLGVLLVGEECVELLIDKRSRKELLASTTIIDKRSSEELLKSTARENYKEFLNEYAELPHEGIGLIVANAFMAEYAEGALWKRDEPWTKPGGTYHKSSRLGKVLKRCVMLAHDAKKEEERCESQYRSTEAVKFRELSERLQAATATALDSLGNDVAYAVACSVEP